MLDHVLDFTLDYNSPADTIARALHQLGFGHVQPPLASSFKRFFVSIVLKPVVMAPPVHAGRACSLDDIPAVTLDTAQKSTLIRLWNRVEAQRVRGG